MANKPKWLAEGTTQDLLTELETLITEGMEKKDVTRAKKIVKEIIERVGEEEDETIIGTFENIIALATEGLSTYESELKAIVEDEEEYDEDDDDEDDEDLYEEDEDDEDLYDEEDDEDEEEEDEVDFSDLTDKELKRLAKREYGVRITKKMKRADIEEAILDAMEDEEDDEEEDYSDWTIQELRKEIKKRGMRSNNKATMEDMRQMLIDDDEE